MRFSSIYGNLKVYLVLSKIWVDTMSSLCRELPLVNCKNMAVTGDFMKPQDTNSPPDPWISKKGYAERLQVSVGTIEGWMCRHWTRGKHYKVIGRTTLINTLKVDEWICQEE